MASELVWKVRDASHTLLASCRDAEAAAAVVGMGGAATVRFGNGGPVVWRQGAEVFSASDSWDGAAELMRHRAQVWQEAQIVKNRNRCAPQHRTHVESCADAYCKGCKET